jgi:hypothetical protein
MTEPCLFLVTIFLSIIAASSVLITNNLDDLRVELEATRLAHKRKNK